MLTLVSILHFIKITFFLFVFVLELSDFSFEKFSHFLKFLELFHLALRSKSVKRIQTTIHLF